MAKIHLMRYARPYRGMIFLTIALLFVQANCDLALPDYLSKIVNTGIQQGGVEHAVPVALREQQMTKITLFMTAENRTRVLDAYTLVENGTAMASDLLSRYPALENQSVYVRKVLHATEIDQLNLPMAKALLITHNIQQALSGGATTQLGMDTSFLDLIPPGMNVFTFVGMLPEDQRVQMVAQIDSALAGFEAPFIIQAAATPILNEYVAIGIDAGHLQTMYLLRIGGIMLVLTFISMLCIIGVGYCAAKVSTGFTRDVRGDLFTHIEHFSSQEFDRFSTASLITRSTNDLTQIQMTLMMVLRMLFFAPIMGVGGTIRALSKTTSMAWLIALAVILVVGIILVVFAIALPKFKIFQELVDRVNLVAREGLSGMLVIRAFNREPHETARFEKANADLTKTSLFVNRLMVVMMPVMMFIMNGLSLAIVWIGAHEVANATFQVGDMMAFMQYAMHIVMSFLMVTMMFIFLPRAMVSADRVAEVLGTDLTIRDAEHPIQFPEPFQGTIEFRDVCFRYPNAEADVLHNISFTVAAGQTTGIIGSTGSGKSTLLSLLLRFYEVTSGQILVDGVDIRNVTQHDLRTKIGYVPQKSTLFSGTIASNLQYADPSAEAGTLENALQVAQATEFVRSKPEGLDSTITQGGSNVSGGQKQRLSIARALVKRAPIYFLDDSASALDFKTEAALRRALKENTDGSTLITVTQRVSSIAAAEQIIVLDEGRIVGRGKHAELIDTCATYREIAESQATLEEFA